uniref:Uncharacterized protein n=1 Tax=Romanomermis culicivorax TaxID=13658 RepID=A0A915L2A6_ROMCU
MLVEPTLPESEIWMGKEVLGRVGMALKAALQLEYALKSYTDPKNVHDDPILAQDKIMGAKTCRNIEAFRQMPVVQEQPVLLPKILCRSNSHLSARFGIPDRYERGCYQRKSEEKRVAAQWEYVP